VPRSLIPALALALALAGAGGAPAQEDGSPFGGFKHDSSKPIEIVSDSLEVRQAENLAIFEGTVEAAQDTLRLTADKVTVSYGEAEGDAETGAIRRMVAEGDVFLSNGSETAEGEWGEYDVEAGMVRMRGDVVLTQGGNAIQGERLVIDMNTGTGRVEGRVRSIFSPSAQEGGN
jgi:lipopolysaccharide export system protein LptA